MQSQIGSRTAATPGNLKKLYLASACTLGLAVAALAAIGASQVIGRPGSVSAPSATAFQSAQPVVYYQPAPPWVYYVVGSQQQAGEVQAALNGPATWMNADGSFPQPQVVVISSQDDEAQLNKAVSDADLFADANGLKGPSIVDLRTPAGAAH